jgi:hypothetical protein
MSFTAKITVTWETNPFTNASFETYDKWQELIYKNFMSGNIDVDSTISDDQLTMSRLVKDVEAGEAWRDAILAHRQEYGLSAPLSVVITAI